MYTLDVYSHAPHTHVYSHARHTQIQCHTRIDILQVAGDVAGRIYETHSLHNDAVPCVTSRLWSALKARGNLDELHSKHDDIVH